MVSSYKYTREKPLTLGGQEALYSCKNTITIVQYQGQNRPVES